jgi:hypothetical protein
MLKRYLLVALAFCTTCSSSKGNGGSGGEGAGTGGSGTGGGVGGGGGAGTGGGGVAPGSASVLQRNKNASRDGHFIDPRMTRARAAKMALDTTFNPTFGAAMWASPLFMENGPSGKGIFIAVTSQNNVYAYDESGVMVWMRNVGNPAASNGPNAPCGNIHPLGILATPVIDGSSRTIYVSAAIGNSSAILRHEVHALSADDGSERPGWPVDVSGKVGFDPQPHNPRSALSLVNGIVYVAYGGHVGDCGNYHGRVVAIDTKDPTKVAGWATGGVGEAIWAPGGMPSDGNGVIATTGNKTGGGGAGHLDSEEIVRITGMASKSDVYFPAAWQQMDGADADFGSSSSIIIDVPGATPSSMVVAPAKTGHVYFLDAKKLGGMGGELIDLNAGTSGFTAPASYQSSKGTFVTLTLGTVRCPSGSGQIAGVLVSPGAPAKAEVAWCATAAGRYSPVATTTDGKSEALVWFMNGTKLNAVDGETGQVIFNGGATDCPGVIKWTSPIVVKGRVIVGAGTRLCAWSAP